jgi:peptidoglycan/LPS O-acetylase OafA/YrhL
LCGRWPSPNSSAARWSPLQGVNDATGIFIPFYLCTFAFALGYVVLAWGLAAARAISPVMAACIALGAALLAVAFATATMWLFILAAALLLVGLGSTSLMVLRETDADWEHTPQYPGFRAAPGTS